MRTAQNLHAFQVEQRPATGNRRVQVHVIGVDPHREHRGRARITGAEATNVPTRPAITVGVLRRYVGNECGDVADIAHAIGYQAGALYRRHGHRNLLQGFFPVLSGDGDRLE
ncbi:hypothetical protein D3C84_753910 [compost metagenome]